MEYVCEKVLNEEDLLFLNYTSNSASWEKIYQHFNIFGADMARTFNELVVLDPIVEKFRKHLRLDDNVKDVRYFLNYGQGSFARIHHDVKTIFTIITLIETVDLTGGETIVLTPYVRPPEGRSASLLCKRNDNEKDNPPYNKHIIPSVVRSEVGDSMIYGSNLRHGVSQVVKGSRKVFVTWFMKE